MKYNGCKDCGKTGGMMITLSPRVTVCATCAMIRDDAKRQRAKQKKTAQRYSDALPHTRLTHYVPCYEVRNTRNNAQEYIYD